MGRGGGKEGKRRGQALKRPSPTKYQYKGENDWDVEKSANVCLFVDQFFYECFFTGLWSLFVDLTVVTIFQSLTNRQTDVETTDSQTNRQMDRQTNTWIDRQTDIWIDSQTEWWTARGVEQNPFSHNLNF